MAHQDIERLQGHVATMKAALYGIQSTMAHQAAHLRKFRDVNARIAGADAAQIAEQVKDLLAVLNGDDQRTRSVLRNFPTELSYDDPAPDLSQPVPLVIRRAREDEKPNFWAGGNSISTSLFWARKYIRMDSPEYAPYIDACAVLRLKPVQEYTGWVEYGDRYAATVSELLEDLRDEGLDEIPPYVHACREEGFEFDAESWLESYLADNHHDEAADRITDMDAFLKAAETFRVKNAGVVTYWSTNEVVVLDQARFEADRAEAQRVVDAWMAGEPVSGVEE